MKHNTAVAAAAAAASAAALLFGVVMDANPKLWLFDKLLVTDRRLQQHFGDKRIWITGASSGIGAALAMQLSKSGASLILSARNEAKLRQVSSQCTGETIILPLDVTSPSQVEAAMEQVGADSIDYLILNAGVGHVHSALETSMEETERLFQVNALAPIQIATMWLRQCSSSSSSTCTSKQQQGRQKRHHLVVTSSVASLFAVPLSASYAASKHAVHGYFQSLRSECSPWLRVDLPCPGPVATDFHVHKQQKRVVNGEQAPSIQTAIDNLSSRREMKMPVERCTRLILRSMMLPTNGGSETWIAQQPIDGI
jgi:short-subunit dehydrogenase